MISPEMIKKRYFEGWKGESKIKRKKMKQWIAFLRSRPALPFVILFLILLYPDRARPQITEPGNPVLEFTNGRWFDGNVFREKTVYVVNGLISFHSARHFDKSSISQVDLWCLRSGKRTITM